MFVTKRYKYDAFDNNLARDDKVIFISSELTVLMDDQLL